MLLTLGGGEHQGAPPALPTAGAPPVAVAMAPQGGRRSRAPPEVTVTRRKRARRRKGVLVAGKFVARTEETSE